MRLRVTDGAPSGLSYPYTGALEPGDEFDVDDEKGRALLDAHDYLREADIILSEDEYTIESIETPVDDDLEDMTRSALYDLAKERDIDGRSDMTKAELIDALED